jgi:hypothetical protein
MIAVRINGVESGLRTDGLVRVGDLIELVKDIVEKFLQAKFIGEGRFLRRVEKIQKLENNA